MWKAKPTVALFMGSIFGGISFFLERSDFGAIIFFLIPGCIVGIVFSGDVHDFSTPVVAVGNFFFYFGLTYLLITVGRKFRVWEKYKEKYSSRPNTNEGKGNSKM